MTEIQKALAARKATKRKKPHFTVKDTHKKSRVPFKWKKPRGKHSPVRQKHKGRPKLVSPGYGSPKIVKHLHSSGLKEIIVQNREQLNTLDPQTQGIAISQKVGNKRRVELLKIALEKKIKVLNLTDPQKYLEKLETQFKERKETKKKKLDEKSKKEEEKKKKAEEKKKATTEKITQPEEQTKETKESDKEKKETPIPKEGSEEKDIEKEKRREIEKTLIKKQ